ncbi:hypothetical protein [Candidatus Chlorohelix sp.]
MGFVGATSVLRQEPPLRVNSHGMGERASIQNRQSKIQNGMRPL